MASGNPARRPEGGEVARLEFRPGGIDHGQGGMAVRRSATMPGNMLQHRQHAAVRQACRRGGRQQGYFVRRLAIGAVANHCVRTFNRHVRHRQAIDRDADLGKIVGYQPRAQPSRRHALGRVPVVEPPVSCPGRIARPMRRTHPLHPTAFLVNQHRRIATAYDFTKFGN